MLYAAGMNLGGRIALALRELGWQQVDLLQRVPGLEAATLSALLTRDSQRSAYAADISRALGTELHWLLTGEGRQWRPGQRQSQSQTLGPTLEPGPDIAGYVPLISWVAAGVWTPIAESDEVEAWLPSLRKLSPQAFALRVRGISMEPLFQAGDILFVDPEVIPDHKRYVVVRLDREAEATFKQLIIEGPKRYLKALNPAWPDPMIEVNGHCTLIGVVVGKWVEL